MRMTVVATCPPYAMAGPRSHEAPDEEEDEDDEKKNADGVRVSS